MTTKPELKGNWDEQKIKLKQKYLYLTDSDLAFEPGKKDKMLADLQVKLGKTRGDLYQLIEAL